MERLFWICLAGSLGTGTRYLVGLWAGERLGTSFPYGTLIVNVKGCFLIAAVMQTAMNVATFPPTLRLALTTGFMGGLTTYSSFGYETTKLAQDGARGAALMNFGVTTAACFAAVVWALRQATRSRDRVRRAARRPTGYSRHRACSAGQAIKPWLHISSLVNGPGNTYASVVFSQTQVVSIASPAPSSTSIG
jgi:fluoride exporter